MPIGWSSSGVAASAQVVAPTFGNVSVRTAMAGAIGDEAVVVNANNEPNEPEET